MDGDMNCEGWVIAEDKMRARLFLVSATGPAQAMALAQMHCGNETRLTLRGSAPEAHLKRRGMQLGDVFEISAKRG